jgi:ABC-type glycerol-3-phosphate transport system permease component
VNGESRGKGQRARAHSRAGRADLLLPTWLSRLVVISLALVVVLPVGYMLALSLTPNQDVALGSLPVASRWRTTCGCGRRHRWRQDCYTPS